MNDFIQVKDATGASSSAIAKWEPEQKFEAARLAEKVLPKGSADTILAEAASVLAHCAAPTDPRQDVGLVVGYVQSGKTLNFTALAALARDNGYPLVLVLTGTAKNLRTQSDDRLLKALLDKRSDFCWQHIAFDTHATTTRQNLENALEDWRDPDLEDSQRKTVLITVLKQHQNLRRLTEQLRATHLDDVPTLIIDDEADQASLNSKTRRSEQSTIYTRIQELRSVFPHHTYVQYTATPQAPLLINLIDSLSPSWVEVLTPGADYTGGEVFFEPGSPYVRDIHPDEVFDPEKNPLESPPDSFRRAVATFFIGVASDLATRSNRTEEDKQDPNRSMLVHPHLHVNRHQKYFDWAKALKESWATLLRENPQDDPDYERLQDLFRDSHRDLATTCSEEQLPAFETLWPKHLCRAIRSANVQEINAKRGKTPAVPFESQYQHLLVGGSAMDRGFTVEGLTVTYMPRGVGGGVADTMQQRARFFGYKQHYLGLCRVWLDPATAVAMRRYVEHEQDIRKQLKKVSDGGQPLKEWKRAFFLDESLKPTRRQVLGVDYLHGGGKKWSFPARPHASLARHEENMTLINGFLFNSQFVFEDDGGHPDRTKMQQHLVVHGVPLQKAYEFLSELSYADAEDSDRHTGVLLQIGRWLELHPDATASVFRMAPGAKTRRRSITKNDTIGPLLQGPNPPVYDGDTSVRVAREISIQVYTLDLLPPDGATVSNITRPTPASVVAVWLPPAVRKGWVVQQ